MNDSYKSLLHLIEKYRRCREYKASGFIVSETTLDQIKQRSQIDIDFCRNGSLEITGKLLLIGSAFLPFQIKSDDTLFNCRIGDLDYVQLSKTQVLDTCKSVSFGALQWILDLLEDAPEQNEPFSVYDWSSSDPCNYSGRHRSKDARLEINADETNVEKFAYTREFSPETMETLQSMKHVLPADFPPLQNGRKQKVTMHTTLTLQQIGII